MDPLIVPQTATGDREPPNTPTPPRRQRESRTERVGNAIFGVFSDGTILSYGRIMSTPVIAIALGAVSYLTITTGKLPERMGDLAIFATSLVGVLYGGAKASELGAKKATLATESDATKASALVKAEAVKASAVVEAEKVRTNGNGNGGKRPPADD